MKSIFTYFLLLMFFSSCSSTYFFSTLDSKNTNVEKQENGDFLIETDSLWIAYCFSGENAPVQVTVYNKLDKPLYVDWGRSALVINDEAFSYAGGSIDIEGYTEDYRVGWSRDRSVGSFGATIQNRENVTFVPPKSKASYASLKLNFDFESLDKDLYQTAKMLDKKKDVLQVKRVSFNEETSPVHIKSYLTVYEEPENPILFEQEFFLTGVIKTNTISPQNLSAEQLDRGDFFFSVKPANHTAGNIFLGVAMVGAGVALELTAKDN